MAHSSRVAAITREQVLHSVRLPQTRGFTEDLLIFVKSVMSMSRTYVQTSRRGRGSLQQSFQSIPSSDKRIKNSFLPVIVLSIFVVLDDTKCVLHLSKHQEL